MTAPLPLAAGVPLAAGGHAYLAPSGVELVFLLLGLVALGAAVLVVTTPQLVHAALWLVVALGALAGCYLLLGAEFVAWVQILVYVGAVVVLLLFGLMLTRAPVGRSPDLDLPGAARLAAAVVAAAAGAVLVVLVIGAWHEVWIDVPVHGDAETTGAALFRTWVLPFEVLSVLLLAALVGAIIVSRRADGPR